MFKYLLLFFFFTLSFAAVAQKPDTSVAKKTKAKDTLVSTRNDTIVTRSFAPKVKKEKIYHPDSTHSPRTAWTRSLMLPGLGQIYNHRWWKVPFIYAGFAALGVSYVSNEAYYTEFNALAHYRENGHTPVKGEKYYNEYQLYSTLPNQSIYDAADGYRRNRDIVILGFAGVWAIQVIEAYVNAKFIHSYSIDSNLSMRISPGLINQPMYAQNFMGSYIPGIKITFALK